MPQPMIRILLVEDELETRLMIQLMLQLYQCHVDFAEDGKTAVTLASRNQYDCILMDLSLPRLNGLEACAAIKQNEAQQKRNATPIIALTENINAELDACHEIGMCTILIKPIKSQFIDRILQCVSKQQQSFSTSTSSQMT